MKVSMDLRLYGLMIICWIVLPSGQSLAVLDGVDRKPGGEDSSPKSNPTKVVARSVESPDVVPAVQPGKPANTLLMKLPVVVSTNVQMFAQSKKMLEISRTKPEGLSKSAVLPVRNAGKAASGLGPDVVVSREPAIIALRLELRQREIELAKADAEIERLKDIVRKIQIAGRHESLVFHCKNADIYRANMMYKRAEEEYLAALGIDPNDAAVHYNLAILCDDDLKDKGKAKTHYEKFLQLAPNDADAPKVREWLLSIVM